MVYHSFKLKETLLHLICQILNIVEIVVMEEIE